MITDAKAIEQTRKWITDVVVACNFCPFAAKEIRQNSIHYQVENSTDTGTCLTSLMAECKRLDNNDIIATTLLIFTHAFPRFDTYLDMVSVAEQLMADQNYEGIYQLASFHPLYLFANAPVDDAANYTNRSVYPMLHLLREDSMEKAVAAFPHPETIPDRNIVFAREKGIGYMKTLLAACL
jgi:uncharacterized protein